MENPIKMDDLGVPLFWETPIFWVRICLRVDMELKAEMDKLLMVGDKCELIIVWRCDSQKHLFFCLDEELEIIVKSTYPIGQ